jgi:hypothetical protein
MSEENHLCDAFRRIQSQADSITSGMPDRISSGKRIELISSLLASLSLMEIGSGFQAFLEEKP